MQYEIVAGEFEGRYLSIEDDKINISTREKKSFFDRLSGSNDFEYILGNSYPLTFSIVSIEIKDLFVIKSEDAKRYNRDNTVNQWVNTLNLFQTINDKGASGQAIAYKYITDDLLETPGTQESCLCLELVDSNSIILTLADLSGHDYNQIKKENMNIKSLPSEYAQLLNYIFKSANLAKKALTEKQRYLERSRNPTEQDDPLKNYIAKQDVSVEISTIAKLCSLAGLIESGTFSINNSGFERCWSLPVGLPP